MSPSWPDVTFGSEGGGGRLGQVVLTLRVPLDPVLQRLGILLWLTAKSLSRLLRAWLQRLLVGHIHTGGVQYALASSAMSVVGFRSAGVGLEDGFHMCSTRPDMPSPCGIDGLGGTFQAFSNMR